MFKRVTSLILGCFQLLLFIIDKTKRISQKRTSGDLLPQPLGKRKRVSFGGHLSPELFDKSLPPNSPLKRGAIPARLSLPFGNSPRAVLKKGQGLKHFAMQVNVKCLS